MIYSGNSRLSGLNTANKCPHQTISRHLVTDKKYFSILLLSMYLWLSLSNKSISRYITSRYLVLLTRFYITSKRTYTIKQFTWCRVQKQHLNKFNLYRRHEVQENICLPPPIYISFWHNTKTNRNTWNHNCGNISISQWHIRIGFIEN